MPHTEIEELIAASFAGESNPEKEALLAQWTEANPGEWESYRDAWDNAEAEWFFEPESTETSRIIPFRETAFRWKTWHKATAVAASLILIAMISFFLIRENEVSSYAVLSQIATEAGQQKELVLPDGSHVRMNASSTLRYPENFSTDNREVYLEGEAYFEVKSDAKRPFVIHGTEANVKVLGTAFNVNSYPGKGMEVAVRSGKVNMVSNTGPEKEVLMVPMMKKGTVNRAKGVWEVGPAEEADFSWLEGKLVFDEQPLGEVVQELSRWYGVKIQLKNQQLAGCRISSTFYRNSLEEVLETLSLIVDLNVSRENGVILLSGKGC